MEVGDRPDNSKLMYCPARATAWQSYADHLENQVKSKKKLCMVLIRMKEGINTRKQANEYMKKLLIENP